MNHLRSSLPLLSLIASLSAVACGSTADDSETKGTQKDTKAGCGLSTQFDGDENCILAPTAEEGLQMHIGPVDYDDPDELNTPGVDGKPLWIMNPGDERTQCYHIYTPNEEGVYYFEQHYRMRTGSHHMIISNSDYPDDPEGWGPCKSSIIGAIGGTQHVIEDLPPGGIVAEEDKGLGRGLEPHTPLDIQLHFYNTSDAPRLREAWVNWIYKPKAEVTSNLGMLGGFTFLNIPPHTKSTIGSECKAENFIPQAESVRIVTLFAHAHTHNTRFVVYKDYADGTEDTVYDSYAGAEAPTYTYNSIVELPVADASTRTTGGKSGLLTLAKGDKLRFSCDVDNDTDYTFYGKNEVNTDEMCNLFGSVDGLGFPCFALPAGATKTPAMP